MGRDDAELDLRGWTHDRRGHVGRPSRKDKPVLTDYSEGIQIKTEDDDPRFNNAVARGLAILRAFQFDRKLLGNVEIAAATGLPKPTVSRLTFTLTQLGYLRYLPEFGKYELAAGVVSLAYPYLVNMPLPAIARPLMEDLAERTRTNIGLGVHEGLSVLYLEYALGEANPNRRQRVGFRVPLIRTSMGRACIAAMPPPERNQLYAELREHYRKEWPQLQQELDGAVEQVDRLGYCIAAGTFQKTTNSVAVPFIHSDGRTLMAFNSQGSASSQSITVMERNGRKLLELAAEVRKRLAAEPPTPSLGRR
ncbi:MAG: Transcriptional regulator, IclR family [uncultured Ramlibacter sp.]|uniref:Transcriptional regulator, IclR family n=1 Tax=uncultured Ramlibacter sp. TaxID=260755 RepID=A0A6J4QD45_9BURK|nr:MAG: Transcriptional regulator, IclR family [uncultured Ramlibacter sp.]